MFRTHWKRKKIFDSHLFKKIKILKAVVNSYYFSYEVSAYVWRKKIDPSGSMHPQQDIPSWNLSIVIDRNRKKQAKENKSEAFSSVTKWKHSTLISWAHSVSASYVGPKGQGWVFLGFGKASTDGYQIWKCVQAGASIRNKWKTRQMRG